MHKPNSTALTDPTAGRLLVMFRDWKSVFLANHGREPNITEIEVFWTGATLGLSVLLAAGGAK